MRFDAHGTDVRAGYGFSLALFLILFFSPDSLVPLYLFTASLLHEAGHYAALRLSGERVSGLEFTFCGMKITRNGQLSSFLKDIFIYICGPLVNLLIFSTAQLFQFGIEFGRINLALALFNLLPVYSLDGGCALYSFFCTKLTERKAKALSLYISLLTVIPLTIFGGFVLLENPKSFTVLAAGIYLLILLLKER